MILKKRKDPHKNKYESQYEIPGPRQQHNAVRRVGEEVRNSLEWLSKEPKEECPTA